MKFRTLLPKFDVLDIHQLGNAPCTSNDAGGAYATGLQGLPQRCGDSNYVFMKLKAAGKMQQSSLHDTTNHQSRQ
jgi:hypothetical protein